TNCRTWTRSRCRVYDGQHGRAGTLSSIESFRSRVRGLIPENEHAEIAAGVVHPRLRVGNHLRRTPHILPNEANRLACTHGGGKVAALRSPKNRVIETVPPRR